MLCQICHNVEATVLLIENKNNQHTSMHICETCAQQRHLEEMLTKSAMIIHHLLGSLLQGGISLGPDLPETKCSNCGMSFQQFKQTGALGCSHCYTTFEANLLPLLRQFHQAEEHRIVSASAWPAPLPTTPPAELKAQLQAAIDEEKYELAAQLRDQINHWLRKQNL